MSDGFRFHHIGVAVRDLDAATTAFAPLGFAPVAELPDAEDLGLCVRVSFLRQQLGSRSSSSSPASARRVAPSTEYRGRTAHALPHLLRVADLEASVSALQSLGYRRITV